MRRYLGRGARWARPTRTSLVVFALASVAIAGLVGWAGWSLLGAPSKAVTLSEAYRFLDGPLRLRRAQEAAWRFSVQGGGGLVRQTDALLSPPLPPALCAARGGQGSEEPEGEREARELGRLVRMVDEALSSGDPAVASSALDRLRAAGSALNGEAGVVAQFAVARALAAGGDLGASARLLEGLGYVTTSGGDLPIVSAATAARVARSGGVRSAQVVLAFHSRYLAGLVAHRRGRPVEAIAHFRRALNAVNYAVDTSAALGRGGHYERIEMDAGDLACGGGEAALTSLDAYAGLVAAYMAAPDFRDPTRLAREVSRRGFEIDPNDPLTPLLVHAQDVADDRRETPIPEHLFWASSNLQRVYHYNRLRPDPRLAVTRAVLTLRVLDDPVWSDALELGGEERCDMLAEVATGLHRDAAASGGPSSPPDRADSAWAAVAVHTFARVEADCPETDVGTVDDAVKGQWLRLGGALLHSGLVARYEAWRIVLEAGAEVSPAETAAAVADRVAGDSRFFQRGRVPPDLSAGIDPAIGAAFVEDWWSAIFRDAADQLVGQVERGAAQSRIRARDAGRYVRVVNAAVAHAGLTPKDVYRPDALDVLARSGGGTARLAQRIQYGARSRPLVTGITLMAGALGLIAGAFLVFVSWWRYTLFTRTGFYRAEALDEGTPGGTTEGVQP